MRVNISCQQIKLVTLFTLVKLANGLQKTPVFYNSIANFTTKKGAMYS